MAKFAYVAARSDESYVPPCLSSIFCVPTEVFPSEEGDVLLNSRSVGRSGLTWCLA